MIIPMIPRDILPGDQISRWVGSGITSSPNRRQVLCTITGIEKKPKDAWHASTYYSIRLERPEGVGANEFRNRFTVTPRTRLLIHREVEI